MRIYQLSLSVFSLTCEIGECFTAVVFFSYGSSVVLS